jgi:hypothetical protein
MIMRSIVGFLGAEELAEWRRLDGPRSPEEDAAPVGDMLIE